MKYRLREIKPSCAPAADWRYFFPCFFIACGRMNETHTIATKETRKRTATEHQKSSSVPIYLPFTIVPAATALPMFCTNSHITSLSQPLPSIFLSAFLLSRSSRPFSPSPSPRFALSEPIYRQSLMHFRHSHQSRFCFTAERSRPSFWLHINCSVGTDQDC